jgi:uncharacterized protein YecE (DUF72 family)
VSSDSLVGSKAHGRAARTARRGADAAWVERMRRGRIYLGTSGWNYRSWKEGFYGGKPAGQWLAHASRVFGALEVNGSFYRQIRPETFRRWRDETPRGFRFALKGHRFITHYRRLRGVSRSIDLLRDPARELGPKLAAVLWQLPADLDRDLERLDGFLAELRRWPEVRHAIEFRHASWFDAEVAARLSDERVAVCLSDAPDFPMWRAVTTDLVYVRLHGHTRKYASSYRRSHLARWADEIRAWRADGRDVHVYLDNDAEGAATRNALTLQELVRGTAAAVSPVPAAVARSPGARRSTSGSPRDRAPRSGGRRRTYPRARRGSSLPRPARARGARRRRRPPR